VSKTAVAHLLRIRSEVRNGGKWYDIKGAGLLPSLKRQEVKGLEFSTEQLHRALRQRGLRGDQSITSFTALSNNSSRYRNTKTTIASLPSHRICDCRRRSQLCDALLLGFEVAPSSLARLILPPATISCVRAPLGISVSGRPHGLHKQITSRLRSGQLGGFLTSLFLISIVVSCFDSRRPIFRFFSSSRSF
jgi:hypothetical protein